MRVLLELTNERFAVFNFLEILISADCNLPIGVTKSNEDVILVSFTLVILSFTSNPALAAAVSLFAIHRFFLNSQI